MLGFPKGPPLRTPEGPWDPWGGPPGGGLLIKDLLISGKVKVPGPPPEKGSPPRFLGVFGPFGGPPGGPPGGVARGEAR